MHRISPNGGKKDKTGGDCVPIVEKLSVTPSVVVYEPEPTASQPHNVQNNKSGSNPVISTIEPPGVAGVHFAEGTNLTEPTRQPAWAKPLKPWDTAFRRDQGEPTQRAGETIHATMENEAGKTKMG